MGTYDIRIKSSAKRDQDFFSERGYPFKVMKLRGSARTAREETDSVGCHIRQIAKSMVFKDKETGRFILVIASGANRVDIQKIKKEDRPGTGPG